MEKLSTQQQNLLSFIQEQITVIGTPPSYREIAQHFGFSSLGTVWGHIQTLKKKGALHHSRYSARTLSLETPKELLVNIPFLGMIAEGLPLETFPRLEEKQIIWKWPEASSENSYLVQVKDTNFKQELLLPEDLLLIEGRSSLSPGQMALVLINGKESLIKRVWPEEEFVRLEASSTSVRTLILRKENVQIQGVILSLMRNYLF